VQKRGDTSPALTQREAAITRRSERLARLLRILFG
jgi:hypothetical protein